jgi:D-glycerate 3-kinase
MKSVDILEKLTQNNSLLSSDIENLLQEELTNKSRCNVFNITPENGYKTMENRAKLWKNSYQLVNQYYQKLGLNSLDIISLSWYYLLPLALKINEEKSKQKKPLIQGILGVQGTGKTTLTKILCLLLKQLGYITISLSIDDFYKTYIERQKLKKIDPRFIWRGPPGTHDVELAIKTLDQLKYPDNSQPISIPRFDKSLWNGQGDRIESETITKADIIFFEGWFVGVRPIENKFKNPPKPIITEEDKQFAQTINQQLETYLPLWEKLDSLIILYPIDYLYSKKWRKEAEQKMILSGKEGMKVEEIEDFVNYFWKALHPELFITPLAQNPNLVDMVITIDVNHRPQQISPYLKSTK